MASVSISCPSCSATDGVVRNGKSEVQILSCRPNNPEKSSLYGCFFYACQSWHACLSRSTGRYRYSGNSQAFSALLLHPIEITLCLFRNSAEGS
ncbi:hypothetical protein CRX72_22490 [Pantoea sp. BRM17]|nr:hypothetical protein CRX72_22490 [Pantoea sp. BRM17]